MRGLLVKDMRLMLAQKMSVALLPIMGIVLLLQYEEGEGGFVVGYMVLLAAIFCMSTLSYDVFDNGMAFLMTLPVKRRVYVFEKYVFIIGTAALVGFITVLVGIVINGAGEAGFGAWLETYFMMLVVTALMISVMMPVQLKFGPEKSRIVMIVIFAFIGAAVTAFSGILGQNESTQEIINAIANMPPRLLTIIIPVVVLIVVIVSVAISVKIIENKEY